MMKSFGDMMKHAQKMKKRAEELQEQLKDERFEASSGGGMIKAVVDGHLTLKELKIGPEALKDGDIEMLEDLIITAVSEAQRSSEAHKTEAFGKITGGFNLPF